MIIVKLQGGLGNQMFEYAAGRALSIRNNTILKFDLSYLLDRSPDLNIVFRDYDLDIFPGINIPIATQEECIKLKTVAKNRLLTGLVKKTIGLKTYFHEKSLRFDETFNNLADNVYLDGYWQTEKYFQTEKNEIRNDFSFSPLQLKKNYTLIEEIRLKKSICLNVRRGDFVTHPGSSAFHGVKGMDYIDKAISLIKEKIQNPFFYIFSDDVEWCRENIKLENQSLLVDHSHAGKKFADYLQLMVACKHFIIPNSSFGWWAAWLNQNPDKIVIAPQKWFNNNTDPKDLIPESWIKI